MSTKREQSAIDMIYLIYDKLESLEKRIAIIEDNVKLTNNRINKLKNSAPKGKPSAKAVDPLPGEFEQSTPSSSTSKLVLGNIKVGGTVNSKEGKALSGVAVSVYDDNNDVVKRVMTNGQGKWEVRLPPGKYGVEYIYQGYKPVNKFFTLDEKMSKYEVK